MKQSVGLTINLVLIGLIVFYLIACKTDERDNEDDYVLEYSLNYYNEKKSNLWQNELTLTQKIDDALFTDDSYFGGYFAYKKKINDTISSLYFELYFNDNDTIFIPKQYYKRYIKEGWQHILSFDKGGDTLYHYKAELYERLLKFFIRGEYYYRYQFNEFDDLNERKFFEQNMDSLTRLQGTNLPPLPIIDIEADN
jgi:hypothetical protein